MDIDIEEEDGRLIVSSEERNHTLFTLLKQSAWDAGGQAGYDKGHPYRGAASLVITADDPAAVLTDAIEQTREQIDAFRDAFDDA